MNIGVFIGSIRAGRAGEAIGHWVHEHASHRNDGHNYEIIDLQDHELPFLAAETVPAMANGEYGDPKTQQWAKVIAQYDGYIFVTPEYNGTVPGPMKNAFDQLGQEWQGKPIGFVGYGYSQAGKGATDTWRTVVSGMLAMQLADEDVNIDLNTAYPEDANGEFRASDAEKAGLDKILDQVTKAGANS